LYTAGLAAQSMPPASQATEWTLDAVVAAALRQHPLIEAAKARVDVARGLRRTAGAVPDPLVSYTTEGGPFPGQTSSALFEPERAVFFSVPFDPFVQRRYRIERTDAEIRSSTSSLAATERQVVRDASEAFYRVALGQAAVVAAQESRTVLDRLVEYLRTRVAQGASPEAELIRAEVERDQTAIDLAFADVELTRRAGNFGRFSAPAATS
jgi:outer membrane protein TolC